MKAQELENEGYKNDKKAPEANCMRTLRTCEEEKINRETCANVSARKELLVRDGKINSTKLSEIINKEINNSIKEINNSIKDAVQTIVKQCSMVPRMQKEKIPILPRLKESKQKSHACQKFCVMKDHRYKLPNVCSNRQITRHASPQYNYLSMRDNSFPYTKTHEDTMLLPVKNKVNNDKKNNKKSTNNVNTDNRRMTGNVNIYICSEAKDSNQEKSKKKSKFRISTDTTTTSSDTTTEQLNSRCASISSCKLINSIQQKRNKLQTRQSSNSIDKKSSSDNIVCDNTTLRSRTSAKELNESSKERINVSDDDIECKNTISSTRDGCCCQDTSSIDFGQDSAVPCSDFNVCDNFRPLQSWTTIYPSEARAMLNDSDVSLSNAICTEEEQRNYRKSDTRNNVCENNNEYAVSRAIDGSRWLPKSIYTDCATYGKVAKERNVNGYKYRNKKFQNSALDRNNVGTRQIEYKLLQQSSENCHREYAARQRSTCSCIAEEEEDCFTNVDKVEAKFPKNVRNNTKCLEKISVCRIPSSKLVEAATVCEISFNTVGERVEQTQTSESMLENTVECPKDKCNNNVKMSICQTSFSKLIDQDAAVCETVSFSVARERFEKMQTCKNTFENSVKCLKGATLCETTFGNSKELPKVTRVCKEFVTEESPEDITVCRRMFGEPKGPPEEVIVCKALPDVEEAPKETICKKVSDSNFVNQDNDKRVLNDNDAKDNLVEENTNSSNLNIQKKNTENERVVQLDNNVALNNFTEQKSTKNIKRDEQTKETVSNNLSIISTAPVGSTKDPFSKSPSKIIYSATSPRTRFYNRSNLISNPNDEETWKTLVNKRKINNQSMRNHFQQSGKNTVTQDLTLDKVNQSEKKMQEELKEEEESQDIPKERRTTEEKLRDSVLNRSVKKLTDVIKLGRIKFKEKAEIRKDKPAKIIPDDLKDIRKSNNVFKYKDKISKAIDSQKIDKKMTMPGRYQVTRKKMTKKVDIVAKSKPTAPVADFAIPEENQKMDISSTIQTAPKLLRIIAAKKSHLPLTVTTVDVKSQELKEEFIPVDIIKNGYVNQEEIPEEKVVPPEPIPAEIEKEIKAEEIIAPEVNAEIEMIVKDISKDVVISKDVTDENKVLKDIDEKKEIYVTCSHKELKEEPQKVIPCKCVPPSDPKDSSCLIVKCATIDVLCPQKKSKEDSSEFISCKRGLISDRKNCPCLIAKYAKCNNTLENNPCKNNEFERKTNYCEYCRLSIAQCICAPTQYLKSCLKTDKPRFRSISPSNMSSHYCMNYYRMREKCMNCCKTKEKCRKIAAHCQHEECRWCTMCNNCSRLIDKCRCGSPVNCINCYRSRDRCCCVTFAPVDCHIETNCDCKKAMICLYCDNSQDKCMCRAPIEKCSYCGLSLDVCDCQNDEDHSNNREQIVRKPNENRTIRVTSWKPKREIRRYFARNLEDFPSDSIEECYCYEKPKRREELPYQRLNIFSDVMNELQQKMSESVCCSRCWRNPCCCGSQIDQDKEEEKKKANVRYPKTEKSSRNKSPNNCRLSPENKHKNIVKKSILVRRIDCVCKLSPCRCKKNRLYKRPRAKCYYCKSLPCTCIIAGSPAVTEAVQVQ